MNGIYLCSDIAHDTYPRWLAPSLFDLPGVKSREFVRPMPPDYNCHPGSVVYEILCFFEGNRDARLTADDVSEKFGVPKNSVVGALARAIEAGLVIHDKGTSCVPGVFRAGAV